MAIDGGLVIYGYHIDYGYYFQKYDNNHVTMYESTLQTGMTNNEMVKHMAEVGCPAFKVECVKLDLPI